MRKILLSVFFSGLIFLPHQAKAQSWLSSIFNYPQLEVSSNVVVDDGDAQSVKVKLTGTPNAYYMIAANTTSSVFIKGTDEADLDNGTQVQYSGRMDKTGVVEVDVAIPKDHNGKYFIQGFISGNKYNLIKRRIFGRSNFFSKVVVVMIVKDSAGSGTQGPKGDKGDTGAQGPAGPQGVKGDTGETGPMGPQGPAGPQGLNGAKGDTGAQGLRGEVGPQGPEGAQGLKGDTGAQGEMGPQGLRGETGLQGLKGDKGDTGAQGMQGERGLQGETGDQGPMGLQGLKGDKGDTGAQGPQGIQGEAGAQGLQGEMGPRGATGPRGLQGIQGETGAQGPTGLTGPAGETGPQGLQGIQGEAGIQGIKGDKGDKGDTGAQGIAGLTPTMKCAEGWIALGPTCIEPDFASSGTLEQAINECYSMGARVCGHQDLAYACTNRAALGVNFPDATWLHTGAVSLRDLNVQNSTYVAYEVYRRTGNRCFGPSTINPSDAVVSYDLFGTTRNYACCMDMSFSYQ